MDDLKPLLDRINREAAEALAERLRERTERDPKYGCDADGPEWLDHLVRAAALLPGKATPGGLVPERDDRIDAIGSPRRRTSCVLAAISIRGASQSQGAALASNADNAASAA
jgi:hypothetical protein